MRTFAKLFGKSPFVPLQAHMEKVSECVAKTIELLKAFQEGRHEQIAGLGKEISEAEHAADQVKHDIQDHLPRSLFLPVDRGRLLEILSVQDSIADKCENIAVLMSLKRLDMVEHLRGDFAAFVAKNVEAFAAAHLVIQQLDELLETSFGGTEAEKVRQMVYDVAMKEHEADCLQHVLLRELFAHDHELSMAAFHMWNHLIKHVSQLSNLSERLANRIRATLLLK